MQQKTRCTLYTASYEYEIQHIHTGFREFVCFMKVSYAKLISPLTYTVSGDVFLLQMEQALIYWQYSSHFLQHQTSLKHVIH
jgi:hypothetical protein